MSVAVLQTTAGPKDILEGTITLPLRGVWCALLEVDADASIVGSVSIVLARDDGGTPQTFRGTVIHGAPWQGRTRAVVAGGKGTLAGPNAPILAPRSYVAGPLLSTIVGDVVADAGEVLSSSVALEGTLVRWLRARGNGADGLQSLGSRIGGWRVLPDGTVWVGDESWPVTTVVGLYQMGDDGHALALDLAPEAANMGPGMTILGRRIAQVTYTVGTALRAALSYE